MNPGTGIRNCMCFGLLKYHFPLQAYDNHLDYLKQMQTPVQALLHLEQAVNLL